MTESLFYTASPVFQVNGQVFGELARDIVRLEVKETIDGLKTMTARFLAYGPHEGLDEETLLYLDGRIFDFGRSINVAIGPGDNQRIIFEGYISAVEVMFDEGQAPEVCIYAEDKLMNLRMTRRMHTYENMTDADIASDIAAKHGLKAEVDANGPTYEVVQQFNMSDLAFLRERARLIQAEVWADKDTLYFKSRDRRIGTELSLISGNDILSIQAIADLSHQRTAVHVSGYDARNREVIDEEAGDDVVQAEISGGRTGGSILQSAFGERISYRVKEVSLTTSEAREWAKAEMLRRARSFVTVSAITSGTPNLVVGSNVTLELMGQPFNGSGYYVTGVCHTFDLSQGHRTQFEAQRATVGAA